MGFLTCPDPPEHRVDLVSTPPGVYTHTPALTKLHVHCSDVAALTHFPCALSLSLVTVRGATHRDSHSHVTVRGATLRDSGRMLLAPAQVGGADVLAVEAVDGRKVRV